jgi:hypothetical protein
MLHSNIFFFLIGLHALIPLLVLGSAAGSWVHAAWAAASGKANLSSVT